MILVVPLRTFSVTYRDENDRLGGMENGLLDDSVHLCERFDGLLPRKLVHDDRVARVLVIEHSAEVVALRMPSDVFHRLSNEKSLEQLNQEMMDQLGWLHTFCRVIVMRKPSL